MQLVCSGGMTLAFFLVISGPSFGQGTRLLTEETEWKEQVSQLPSFPQSENLIKVKISSASKFEFFVDESSISVGSDGVVRYSLVARSASGAGNISFEGIRCRTRERKTYAIGRSTDRSWSLSRSADWVEIRRSNVGPHHEALASQFFCLDRSTVPNASRAIDLLRRG